VHGVARFFEPFEERPLQAEFGRVLGPHGGGQLPRVPHQQQALLKHEGEDEQAHEREKETKKCARSASKKEEIAWSCTSVYPRD
jgi:hypothetical protein